MSSYNIGVIFPSRGLLFTETLKELLQELQGVDYTIYWSHGNSLPSCFNVPLRKALKASHSHIWIVEDDMVLTKGVLQQLLKAKKPIVACDYPISEEPSGTVMYDSNNQAIFTGTGCILIKTEVLRAMPKTVFRADISWQYLTKGDKLRFTANTADPKKVYGQHDISFGLYHYMNTQPIYVIPTVLAQRKLKRKGDSANNIGTDEIVLFNQFKRKESFFEAVPATGSALVDIYLDGTVMSVQPHLAKKLLAEGKAVSPMLTQGDVIIDLNGNAQATKYIKGKK